MNNRHHIDINCDLGEGNSLEDCANDALLMRYISSRNIACGGHAGNLVTIRESLRNAKLFNLKIGAHPGYPDKANFGRISAQYKSTELEELLKKQIDLVVELAAKEKYPVNHIKLHGALYNDVENNRTLASVIAKIFADNYSSLKVLGLANGQFQQACQKLGLKFIAEGFVDRTYLANGRLSSRVEKLALITDAKGCLKQTKALVNKTSILTLDNKQICIDVETICLHGDNPQAVEIAKAIQNLLNNMGIITQ